eukprot:jgi/Mesvir1/3246/Mv16388-RA.1
MTANPPLQIPIQNEEAGPPDEVTVPSTPPPPPGSASPRITLRLGSRERGGPSRATAVLGGVGKDQLAATLLAVSRSKAEAQAELQRQAREREAADELERKKEEEAEARARGIPSLTPPSTPPMTRTALIASILADSAGEGGFSRRMSVGARTEDVTAALLQVAVARRQVEQEASRDRKDSGAPVAEASGIDYPRPPGSPLSAMSMVQQREEVTALRRSIGALSREAMVARAAVASLMNAAMPPPPPDSSPRATDNFGDLFGQEQGGGRMGSPRDGGRPRASLPSVPTMSLRSLTMQRQQSPGNATSRSLAPPELNDLRFSPTSPNHAKVEGIKRVHRELALKERQLQQREAELAARERSLLAEEAAIQQRMLEQKAAEAKAAARTSAAFRAFVADLECNRDSKPAPPLTVQGRPGYHPEPAPALPPKTPPTPSNPSPEPDIIDSRKHREGARKKWEVGEIHRKKSEPDAEFILLPAAPFKGCTEGEDKDRRILGAVMLMTNAGRNLAIKALCSKVRKLRTRVDLRNQHRAETVAQELKDARVASLASQHRAEDRVKRLKAMLQQMLGEREGWVRAAMEKRDEVQANRDEARAALEELIDECDAMERANNALESDAPDKDREIRRRIIAVCGELLSLQQSQSKLLREIGNRDTEISVLVSHKDVFVSEITAIQAQEAAAKEELNAVLVKLKQAREEMRSVSGQATQLSKSNQMLSVRTLITPRGRRRTKSPPPPPSPPPLDHGGHDDVEGESGRRVREFMMNASSGKPRTGELQGAARLLASEQYQRVMERKLQKVRQRAIEAERELQAGTDILAEGRRGQDSLRDRLLREKADVERERDFFRERYNKVVDDAQANGIDLGPAGGVGSENPSVDGDPSQPKRPWYAIGPAAAQMLQQQVAGLGAGGTNKT